MYTININEEAESIEVLSDALKNIASKLDEGYTSGYYPTWKIEEICDTCGGSGKVDVIDQTGDIIGFKKCSDCTPEDDMDMSGSTPGDR